MMCCVCAGGCNCVGPHYYCGHHPTWSAPMVRFDDRRWIAVEYLLSAAQRGEVATLENVPIGPGRTP